MFCKYCGAELKFAVKYCPECGSPTKEDDGLGDVEIKKEKVNETKNVENKKNETSDKNKKKKNMFEIYFDEQVKGYFNFTGKTQRKEFYASILVWFLILIVPAVVCACFDSDEIFDAYGMFAVLFILFSGIPMFAMATRRVRDAGLSGWMVCTVFIPSFGMLILFILSLLPTVDKKAKPVTNNSTQTNDEKNVKVPDGADKNENIKNQVKGNNLNDFTDVDVRTYNGINIAVTNKNDSDE